MLDDLHQLFGQNALRLAYAGVTPKQINEGVMRLAAAYRSIC